MRNPTPPNQRAAYEVLIPLVRERLWPPDGKPPEAWNDRREGSVLKRLLVHRSVSQIEVAILGLARLRDTGQINWLKPGQKVTSRALYNTRSGASQMFELATREYWRTVKRTPKRSTGFSGLGEIMYSLAVHSDTYREYMRSPAWAERRKKALAAAGLRCERCRAFGKALDVHHLNYANLGHERDEDLQVLCIPCHKVADAERGRRIFGAA